jgi:hypothetical protein
MVISYPLHFLLKILQFHNKNQQTSKTNLLKRTIDTQNIRKCALLELKNSKRNNSMIPKEQTLTSHACAMFAKYKQSEDTDLKRSNLPTYIFSKAKRYNFQS